MRYDREKKSTCKENDSQFLESKYKSNRSAAQRFASRSLNPRRWTQSPIRKFFCSSLNRTCIIALRLSHDFLHLTLIVLTMIYKRRYEWHKDVLFFSNVSAINVKWCFIESEKNTFEKHLCITHSVVWKSLLHNRSFGFRKKSDSG